MRRKKFEREQIVGDAHERASETLQRPRKQTAKEETLARKGEREDVGARDGGRVRTERREAQREESEVSGLRFQGLEIRV